MTSSSIELTVRSGSAPLKMSVKPSIVTYTSPDSVKIKFTPPSSNGGYSITSFKVYLDNSVSMSLQPIGPHEFTLSSLVTGTSYKIQVSLTSLNILL